jgi:TetR/AcrR family transcriptional regulator, transcriptional repressor for nem operon
MKRSKADTAETRRRIVEIASQAFRGQGIEATGVAEIMAAAGLTHGGFYRHFSSKEELVAEAVAMSLEQLVLQAERAAELGAEAALNHALEYLSPTNRDDVEHSCTFAAAGSELARADDKTRRVASEAFKRTLEGLAPFMCRSQGADRSSAAISVLTNMIGALTMARMVDDPVLSDRILAVTRERLIQAIKGRGSQSPVSGSRVAPPRVKADTAASSHPCPRSPRSVSRQPSRPHPPQVS